MRQNVEEGLGDLVKHLKRYEEISNAFADPDIDPGKMEKLLEEQSNLQEKSNTPTVGISIAPWISPWTRFVVRRLTNR